MIEEINIDELSAGKELDELVARVVMGWDNCSEGYGRAPEFQDEEGLRYPIPKYSIYIAFAFQVANHVFEKSHYFHLYRNETPITDYLDRKGQWECKLVFAEARGDDKRYYYALAETAPLAICRAALRAIIQKGCSKV